MPSLVMVMMVRPNNFSSFWDPERDQFYLTCGFLAVYIIAVLFREKM
jgi:hypothetical protein